MAQLAEIIEWKYGPVASTKQKIKGDRSNNPAMVIKEWRHPTIPQPDDMQLAKDEREYENYLKSIAYAEIRKEKYPSTEDQLDAFYQIMQAQREGKEPPKAAYAVLDQIKKVKQENPKP